MRPKTKRRPERLTRWRDSPGRRVTEPKIFVSSSCVGDRSQKTQSNFKIGKANSIVSQIVERFPENPRTRPRIRPSGSMANELHAIRDRPRILARYAIEGKHCVARAVTRIWYGPRTPARSIFDLSVYTSWLISAMCFRMKSSVPSARPQPIREQFDRSVSLSSRA